MASRMRVHLFIITLLFSIWYFAIQIPMPVDAATVRADESIYISEEEQNLSDLYLFGETITIDAPIKNDLTVAGGDITLNGDVSGSIMALGGDLSVRSNVAQTVRVAGGNVAVSGHIARDLLIAGGSVRITKEASISGDVLFLGGQLTIDGPVQGKIYLNGGDITINNTVGKNVEGSVGKLTLGQNARIAGDLIYRSEEKAFIAKNARIQGQQRYDKPVHTKEQATGLASIITRASIYQLAIDIVVSLLLVSFLPALTKKIVATAQVSPLSSAGKGFLTLFFMPLISILLLILLWLGIAAILLYGLVLILSMYFAKILIGAWVLRIWEGRKQRVYTPDWKAAVVGSCISFILLFIPILGWALAFAIYLIALGSLTTYGIQIIKQKKEL